MSEDIDRGESGSRRCRRLRQPFCASRSRQPFSIAVSRSPFSTVGAHDLALCDSPAGARRAPAISPRRSANMKTKKLPVLLALGALVVPAGAQAHISLHPNTIPAGAFVTLDVRVPGEQEGAYVKKVDMLFPPGFTGVDYENVSGWSTKVIESKLATPIKEDGGTIDTEVSQIVWTWVGPLGKVNNGQFIQFPLSLA